MIAFPVIVNGETQSLDGELTADQVRALFAGAGFQLRCTLDGQIVAESPERKATP